MPAGRNYGFDGRGPFEMKNAEAVIAASVRAKTDLFIDRDHQTLYMPKGTEVVAAGWIKKMEARNGEIWGFVEWVDKASAQLAAKEYRYISPVFKTNPATGEITQIIHASLTNNPNFELTAVASADLELSATPTTPEEKTTMDELLKKLAALLGLAETATQDEIFERVQNLQTGATATEAASAEVAAIRKILKLDTGASLEEEIQAMAAKIETGEIKKPNASEYVPMSVFNELKTSFANLQQEQTTKKAGDAVDAAMSSGKVSPAQKEWALEYASADLAGFNKYVAAAPVIVAAAAEGPGGQPRKDETRKLTPEASSVLQAMGVDLKAAEKNLQQQVNA